MLSGERIQCTCIGCGSSRCGVRGKVHVIRGADTMYNSRSSDRMQLQISSAETEVIASNFIRPQTMIAVVIFRSYRLTVSTVPTVSWRKL
jgi:hypothetical protein